MARKKKAAAMAECIGGPIDGITYESSHQTLILQTTVPSVQHVYVRRLREDDTAFYAYIGVLTGSEKVE